MNNSKLIQPDTANLAQETWNKAVKAHRESGTVEAIAEIKSALKQAYNLGRNGYNEGFSCGHAAGYDKAKSEQHPRGEPWTVERSKEGVNHPMARIMQSDKVIIGWTMRPFSESFPKIADAHNASIGADAGERVTKRLAEFVRRCADHMICGSNIADTPLPTMDEWREVLAIADAAMQEK